MRKPNLSDKVHELQKRRTVAEKTREVMLNGE